MPSEEQDTHEDPTSSQAPQASQRSQTSTTYGVRTVSADKVTDGALACPEPLVSMNETNGHMYSFRGKTTDSVYPRLAEEARARFVGPMPPTLFLDRFLARGRIPEEGKPSCDGAFSQLPDVVKKESVLYKPLADAFNLNRCPGFSFHVTAEHADQTGPSGRLGGSKPDICCYAERHLVHVPVSNDGVHIRADMGLAAFYFEIKASLAQDFFRDPPPGTDRSKWKFVHPEPRSSGASDLGQAVSYAVEICKRQHRHCCYSVSISGTNARFIRWDRAGAVVTETFSLIKHPELLCDFLWCFAHVSDVERGYDLTVELANSYQEGLFRAAIEKHVRMQLPGSTDESAIQAAVDEHYQPGVVTIIYLPGDTDAIHEERYVLVSRPIAIPLSVVGRCTRTYWAYDSEQRSIVLLKDTWRYDVYEADDTATSAGPPIEREGEVLDQLAEAGVRNVPCNLYHEDVPKTSIAMDESTPGDIAITYLDETETTQTQIYLKESWVCGYAQLVTTVHERKHYRLLLNIAGYPMLRLSGGKELLTGAYQAFQALQDAWLLAKRLHRDITPGNIIFYSKGGHVNSKDVYERCAYLIDWDLSISIEASHKRRDVPISVTWQFLSARICASLPNPEKTNFQIPSQWQMPKVHTVQDDMESIIYVVLYCGLLWLPHKLKGVELHHLLDSFFDTYYLGTGGPTGGHSKITNKLTRLTTGAITWKSRGMTTWLATMMDMFSPIPGKTDPKYSGKWTPQAVNAWWARFLREYEPYFGKNDRINNIGHPSNWPVFKDKAPIHAFGKPHQGTQPSAELPPAQYTRSAVEPANPTVAISESNGINVPAKRSVDYFDFLAPTSIEDFNYPAHFQSAEEERSPKRVRHDHSSTGTWVHEYDSDASMRTLPARNPSRGGEFQHRAHEPESGDDVSMASGSRFSDLDDVSMASGHSGRSLGFASRALDASSSSHPRQRRKRLHGESA